MVKIREQEMQYRSTQSLWLGLIPFLLFACAAPAPQKEAVRPPQPYAAPEAKLPEMPMIQVEKKPALQEKSRRRYSLSLRDSEIKEILLALCKESELSLIIDPDVTGKATVELKDVTLIRALDSILKPLGLTYSLDGDFLRVSKPKVETRIFTLNYITSKRTGTSRVAGTVGGGGGTTTTGTVSSGQVSAEIKTETTSDLWQEVEAGLKNMLSESGKFFVNKMASAIIVMDFPQNLNAIAQFLEAIDGSVQRQVIIEAKIIEVVLSDQFQMGINWSYIPAISGVTGTLSAGAAVAQSAVKSAKAAEIFQIGLATSQEKFLLDAMASQGTMKILSAPKISTLNNQQALIKVGREDVFFEVTTSRTVGQPEETTATPRYVTVGMVLAVTPQIDKEGQIIMNIHPSITERVGEATSRFGDTAPIIDVRETETMVRVRNGQTIVIAGLLQDKSTNEETGVPLLSDIPVLGHLFKSTKVEKKKTELVILLTPKILMGRKIDELSAEELERLDKASQGMKFWKRPWKKD